MTEYDQQLIERKLSHISRYLLLLKAKSILDQETFLADTDQQLATERLIQLLVEISSDLGAHLIVAKRGDAPTTYRDFFKQMGDMKIISDPLAQQLMLAAGMRNRLVHEYEDIDLTVVFETIPIATSVFTQFLKEINAYLAKDYEV
ncbi:MAG: DUF86 domain-containing protein [Synechococcales cyanobacterium]